jgi:serine/threonine protein kinase
MLGSSAEALVDLIAETSFLLQLEHTNIVHIRALAEVPPYDPNFFLVIVRYLGSAGAEMAHTSKPQHSHAPAPVGSPWPANQRSTDTDHESKMLWRFVRRSSIYMIVASYTTISSPLTSVMMCAETSRSLILDCHDHEGSKDNNGPTYLYSKAGSLRYMAPEVVLGQPYNTGVDVYSLSLIVWQMVTLEQPYKGLRSENAFERSVGMKNMQPSLRPLPPMLAKCIKPVLRWGWHGKVETRSTISEMRRGIQHVLDRLDPSVCAKPCQQCGYFRFFPVRLSQKQKKQHTDPSTDLHSDSSSMELVPPE